MRFTKHLLPSHHQCVDQMALTVLSAQDVHVASNAICPEHLVSLMAKVFVRLHARDRISLPHRTSITTEAYNVLFMPARIDDFSATIKTVSVPGPNSKASVQATTLVLDEESGAVKAVVNATSLTALRTAAGKSIDGRSYFTITTSYSKAHSWLLVYWDLLTLAHCLFSALVSRSGLMRNFSYELYPHSCGVS